VGLRALAVCQGLDHGIDGLGPGLGGDPVQGGGGRVNGERVTLKRFYVEADGIRLQPANPAMEPIYLRHEELQILGIVSGVVRT